MGYVHAPGRNSRQDASDAFEEGKSMFHILCKTLTIALAVLCVMSATALAADGTLSGTVQNVDPQQGRITIRAGEDNVVELRAPAELLIGLQSGDAVEVKRSGQQATFIKRQQESGQRPDIGGTLQLQPPVEMPKAQ
jgi:hypothetical protein